VLEFQKLSSTITKVIAWLVGCFDGVLCHFQQYFSYIVAVSFIGGGNRRTRRKSPTCCKS